MKPLKKQRKISDVKSILKIQSITAGFTVVSRATGVEQWIFTGHLIFTLCCSVYGIVVCSTLEMQNTILESEVNKLNT